MMDRLSRENRRLIGEARRDSELRITTSQRREEALQWHKDRIQYLYDETRRLRAEAQAMVADLSQRFTPADLERAVAAALELAAAAGTPVQYEPVDEEVQPANAGQAAAAAAADPPPAEAPGRNARDDEIVANVGVQSQCTYHRGPRGRFVADVQGFHRGGEVTREWERRAPQ